MPVIRTIKTSSGKTAVQLVERVKQETKIVKHIGSAGDNKELDLLMQKANVYCTDLDTKYITPLFPELFPEVIDTTINTPSCVEVLVDQLSFTHTLHTFAYEFLAFFYEDNGFHKLQNKLLQDLVIIRLIEPSSKLRSIELLQRYFAITYHKDQVYEPLQKLSMEKDKAEQIAITYAKKHLNFTFSLVLYDVTTLYFETTEADKTTDAAGNVSKGLRSHGFSKDNKPHQPQIMIGLVVTKEGYPIAIEMFDGKTFEGHTMIPVIKKLQETYGIETLTIVADAGMLSAENLDAIKASELSYIVGARLGNTPIKLLQEIAENLNKTENIYYQKATDKGLLICDYSQKRAAKDKSDRKKQLKKAQYHIENPEKMKRRTRFVTEETKNKKAKLNHELIAKDECKEGIKGYYTNLVPTEKFTVADMVNRYKDLWHVEKSFRIAKSDLQARPLFHHKKDSIAAHILIVFISLCIARTIEKDTGYSLKRVRDMIWQVQDIFFTDTKSNKQFCKRMDT
ncbi:MAG: IS1634 family transposase, partial [Nanoarchaeota archaeon]